jgi:very-short-patch-repair endonuclease
MSPIRHRSAGSRPGSMESSLADASVDVRVSARTVARRSRVGTYERVHPGVYRVAGAPATRRQELMAACLACGPGAAVSHRAAAALWGLPRFETGPIELTARRARRHMEGCALHWSAMTASDVKAIDGIPVTSVARTLADMAACVNADLVEEALDDALYRRLVTLGLVRRQLRPGRAGTTPLRRLIDARSGTQGVPESVFETRVLRMRRAGGLPAPAVQQRVGSYRVDLACVRERLAIEADGFRWHSSRQKWDRDRARAAALTAMGWTLFHVTWPQLHDRPDEVVDAVRRMLTSLGANPAPSR